MADYQLGAPDIRACKVYIYGLVDPRDATIRYVGRTAAPEKRFSNHFYGCTSRPVKAWIRALRDLELEPRVQILHVVPAGEDADDAEYLVIRSLRRHGEPLLNNFAVELRARERRTGSVKARPRRARTEHLSSPDPAVAESVAHAAQLSERGATIAACDEFVEPEFEPRNIFPAPARSALPRSRPLTERQGRILSFVSKYIDSRGFAPSLREIGAAVGITSTNGVNDHLRALERKGFIWREKHVARAIRLVSQPGGNA